jgi:hypothetical protein
LALVAIFALASLARLRGTRELTLISRRYLGTLPKGTVVIAHEVIAGVQLGDKHEGCVCDMCIADEEQKDALAAAESEKPAKKREVEEIAAAVGEIEGVMWVGQEQELCAKHYEGLAAAEKEGFKEVKPGSYHSELADRRVRLEVVLNKPDNRFEYVRAKRRARVRAKRRARVRAKQPHANVCACLCVPVRACACLCVPVRACAFLPAAGGVRGVAPR